MSKNPTLETTAETLEKDRVKIRVEVPEDAIDPALKQVYRRWSQEIKVPGFRKGKVPRQIIDSRVGPEVIREEALRDALPDIYRDALRAEDLEAITTPDIEVTQFEQGKPIVLEVTVDIRPEVNRSRPRLDQDRSAPRHGDRCRPRAAAHAV